MSRQIRVFIHGSHSRLLNKRSSEIDRGDVIRLKKSSRTISRSDLLSLSKFHSFLGIGCRAWKCLFTRWKRTNRVSFKSRWNDWHFRYWWMSKRVPKFQWLNCISRHVCEMHHITFFFFYFYYENLIFNILKTIDTSPYKISIRLICIVFTPGINLSAPCKRIVEAPRACYSRMLFFLTRAQKL